MEPELTQALRDAVVEVRKLDGATAEMRLDLGMVREINADTLRRLKDIESHIALRKLELGRERREARLRQVRSLIRRLIGRSAT